MGWAVIFHHIKTTLPPSLSASPAHHHFSLGHPLDSGWTESSWSGETNANHLVQGFSQFMHSLFLSNNHCPKMGTHLIPHNSPAFFEQPTPFPHIPFVHCTFTICFNNLPVSFHQTFCNLKIVSPTAITSSRSFMFILNYYSKWGLKKYDIILCNTCSPWHIKNDWPL
jgi:hypothetical protein